MRLIKTHGSLNEIFALEARPDAWASDTDLRAFVRTVCDRDAWTGGSDGIYLYDPSGPNAQAWFFNPDGSLGRVLRQRDARPRTADPRPARHRHRDRRQRRPGLHGAPRAVDRPRASARCVLELPPLSFSDAALPAPFEAFTAVAVPNPHVISVVDAYSEPDLIELGKRADEVFPAGANVSFLQPLE